MIFNLLNIFSVPKYIVVSSLKSALPKTHGLFENYLAIKILCSKYLIK